MKSLPDYIFLVFVKSEPITETNGKHIGSTFVNTIIIRFQCPLVFSTDEVMRTDFQLGSCHDTIKCLITPFFFILIAVQDKH